jgi:hypothetical protein
MENRTFDPSALMRLLDGRYAEVRQELRGVLCRPEFAPVAAMPTAEYRGVADVVLVSLVIGRVDHELVRRVVVDGGGRAPIGLADPEGQPASRSR